MKDRLGAVLIVVLTGMLLAAGPFSVFAVEAIGPRVAIYVTQNIEIKLAPPEMIETTAGAHLARLGYKVVPLRPREVVAQMCPRDVRGVWEADRCRTFQQHVEADILWMAAIEYKPVGIFAEASTTATISTYACAFDVASGDLLWRGQVKDYPLSGATLASRARNGLEQIMPALVSDFDRAPRVRVWVPASRPSLAQPNLPAVRATTSTIAIAPGRVQPPEASQSPYTGVIIETDHIPGFRPSYRTGIYSPEGQQIYRPGPSRMSWADNEEAARQQAGPQPLRIKALRTEGSRIVLPESAARQLQTNKSLLERSPVTVRVRPPKH
ncbi:hypothetical protein FJY63_05875 [Candidatus Sumerlaeota bacterium]|nr:hypothetical protein [Candidatus Sumerlaeota bacterium]